MGWSSPFTETGGLLMARSGFVWLLVSLLACVVPPAVEVCPPRVDQKPPPTVDCLESAEGLSYTTQAARGIGDDLMGWVSYPGEAMLSVEFADDTKIDSVCVRRSSGDQVKKRVPRAVERVRKLPPAPACFAGRRLEFQWQSPVLTDHELRSAISECRKGSVARRAARFCRVGLHCSIEEYRQTWAIADREVRACVLHRIPITLNLESTQEVLYFRPIDPIRPPDPTMAMGALDVCSRWQERSEAVGCMFAHGWRPVE